MLLSGLGRDSPTESVLFNAGNFKVDSPTQWSLSDGAARAGAQMEDNAWLNP